jgi:hypothetical protein
LAAASSHILLALGLLLGLASLITCGDAEQAGKQVSDAVPTWSGSQVTDLHREYQNIFLHGNRNAASHLWSTFLLDRSAGMSRETLELMFSGFCAVSGSPIRPNDYNRYLPRLPLVDGSGDRAGIMH